MKNKITVVAFAGLLINSIPCFAEYGGLSGITPSTKESPAFGKCLQWTEKCYKKKYCIQREELRNGSCFRCVKPTHYGFHVYPREMEQNTCNQDTMDYLKTMGYYCYRSYKSGACLQSVEREFCDSVCAQYAKPGQTAMPEAAKPSEPETSNRAISPEASTETSDDIPSPNTSG